MRGVEPSYTLLRDIAALPQRVRERMYDRMPAGRNVKTTSVERFEALDKLVLQEMAARFPEGRAVKVHDIAASNAIASAHWFRQISRLRPVAMKASDYFDRVLCVHVAGLDFIFDAVGEPLQVALGATALSVRRAPWSFLTAPWWRLARRKLAAASPISLFHPDALKLAAENANFSLAREDFFHLPPEQFDVVRLTNVLGPTFTPEQNALIFQNTSATVAEGGLLVVGARKNYSILSKAGGQWTEVASLGSGYRAEPSSR